MAALSAPLSALANTAETASPAQPALPAPPVENPIRIGLGVGLTSAAISAPAGLTLVAGDQVVGQFGPGEAVNVTLNGGALQVTGLEEPLLPPVRLVPAGEPGATAIGYKGKSYRGEIELVLSTKSGKLSVVNLVSMEEYLFGVVPHEMPSGWPLEALKAQAVAARTYATVNRGKYKADGFDLVDTNMDQAYGGIASEAASTTQAVQETRGMVLTYGGAVVTAYYHSSSGGHTENNENVWSGPAQPYLRGVPDFDQVEGNTRYSWKYSFTVGEFAERLKRSGYDIGSVQSVLPAGTLGVSGRPSQWAIQGSSGKMTLTAYQFRMALDLPSAPRTTQFRSEGVVTTIVTQTTNPATVHAVGAGGVVTARPATPVTVVTAAGTTTLSETRPVYVVGASGTVAVNPVTVTVEKPGPAQPSGVEIAGGGYGHAVGLSQWGANGMARQGKSFTEILTHFYTGIKVETR